MSIESLKEKARNHEQREEWKAALDTYLQAIRKLDEDDQTDIGLYNRVGDIAIRLGQIDKAAEHYIQSVELYAEAELPNNAIAVCKKIIRNIPTRTDVYLKMGQIRASQGFLTDARQSFLTYAERTQQEGDLEEAFRALIEFADLAPDDIGIRLALASQLQAHDRQEEAVEQLLEARDALIVAGRDEDLADVEQLIAECAPDTELPDPEAIRARARESSSHDAFEPDALALEGVAAAFGDHPGDQGAGPPEARNEGQGAATSRSFEGLESTSLVEGEEPPAEKASAPAAQDDRSGPAAEADDAEEGPEADEDSEEGLEALAALADAFEAPESSVGAAAEDGGPGDRHEILDDWEAEAADADDQDEAADLPLLDFGEADGSAEDASVMGDDWLTELTVDNSGNDADEDSPAGAGLEDPVFPAVAVDMADAPEPDEPSAVRLLEQGMAAVDAGRLDDGVPVLERASKELAASGDFVRALDAIGVLTAHAPDTLEYHQRAVEYAFQVNDKAVLTQAYLDLASCLDRGGNATKARAVYQQVLGVDPENALAREALSDVVAAEAPATVEVASSEDYVDLGALVFEDEAEEKTTRWFVEMADPSGDDEADFAKMLTQFKAKVAEHLEADDVRAHYDLGTAYREMGLLDEAIAEFQQALRGSHDHLPTYELLGQCFMEKGQYEVAVRSMSKALTVPHEVEDELLGIYYYLGRAHEKLGNQDPATEFYEKIFALDINFRDVTERLRALR